MWRAAPAVTMVAGCEGVGLAGCWEELGFGMSRAFFGVLRSLVRPVLGPAFRRGGGDGG